MKALRFVDGELKLTEAEPPHHSGEALVRVVLAGICHTDLEILRGYAGFNGTLGHEFVGVVEDSPEQAQIGQRVVGEINVGCGVCADCRAGDARHCAKRNVLGIRGRDGAFAEFLSLPPQNLRPVPAAVSDRAAVFTEPLAAACEILEQVSILPQHRVAVSGAGKLGQLIARVLVTTGCELILIGKHADQLELAAQAGIKTKLSTAVENAQFDCVVEASGSVTGLQAALNLVRPRGTIILKSTVQGAVPLDTAHIVVNEITVLGSRCGRFDKARELLASGQINVEPLIAGEFALADGLAAIRAAQRLGTLKILLRP